MSKKLKNTVSKLCNFMDKEVEWVDRRRIPLGLTFIGYIRKLLLEDIIKHRDK